MKFIKNFWNFDFHSVRGLMNSMCFLANSIGSLIAFIFALNMDYQNQAICALFVPILFAFAFSFVPETPVFLQRINKTQVKMIQIILKNVKILQCFMSLVS